MIKEKLQETILFFRPCKRALMAIDENLRVTQELQDKIADLDQTLIRNKIQDAISGEAINPKRRASDREVPC